MLLSDPVSSIPGIGPKRSEVLKHELGILTVLDLFYHVPRSYLDRSRFEKIKDCFVNSEVTVAGKVIDVRLMRGRKRFVKVFIDDGTDTLAGVFFGSTSYYQKLFSPGDQVLFSGRVTIYGDKQITHPEFDIISDKTEGVNTGRIIPLYPSGEALKKNRFDSRGFRKVIAAAWKNLHTKEKDLLRGTLPKEGYISLLQAVEALHFPSTMEELTAARERLVYNENLLLQYILQVHKKTREMEQAYIVPEHTGNECISSIPFTLTGDQKKAIEDISLDMSRGYGMFRLLQGDVGSGKTIVALAACCKAAQENGQSALMVPTEVLAQQHFSTFSSMIPSGMTVALVTANTSDTRKKACSLSPSEGGPHIIIGTHALFQKEFSFHDLRLVIIDEQHRFGVHQRTALLAKGKNPHFLSMTATPIPRTLTMTLFGDMEISSIREKPSGRKEIETLAFPGEKLGAVYNSLEKYINEGRQVYYILPLIEDSESLNLVSVEKAFQRLQSRFPDFRCSIIHGRMKGEEKTGVMEEFNRGDVDILVSTTVIEVGIDNRNASIIVIEHAERFGLAQLHQLRGRVGRGEHRSYCVLVYHEPSPSDRIKIMLSSNDGFYIAEEDLKLRGAGEVLGQRQHGREGALTFTDPAIHGRIMESAKADAQSLVSELKDIKREYTSLSRGIFPSQFIHTHKKKITESLG